MWPCSEPGAPIASPVAADQRRRCRDKDEPSLLSDEYAQSQWSLPALYSHNPGRPLVDWDFEPVPKKIENQLKDSLDGIAQPRRFIGRRLELRTLGKQIREGSVRQLLLTAIGGQGKTALAGRLARNLEKRGYVIAAYAADQEATVSGFVGRLRQALSPESGEAVDRQWGQCANLKEQYRLLLTAVLSQCGGKLVLFLDNLESVQEKSNRELKDDGLAALLGACRALGEQLGSEAPVVLATSRWAVPGWEAGERAKIQPLKPPNYGDFLRFSLDVLKGQRKRELMRKLYEGLGGSFKGLELLAAATGKGARGKKALIEEEALLELVEGVREELRTFTAIGTICEQLPQEDVQLLSRMRAYHTPMIEEGIRVVAGDLPDCRESLRRLEAYSLVDVEPEPMTRIARYRLPPVVEDWIVKSCPELEEKWREKAAKYQLWLSKHLIPTLGQVMVAHRALTDAGFLEEAHKEVLDWIVEPFTRAGRYRELLEDWLPPLLDSKQEAIRGRGLGQMGKVCLHVGDYGKALEYLEQSLAICREIGDRQGEGTTLNNISQIYDSRGDYGKALEYLEQSLAILREIGDRQGEGATLNNISQIYKARGDYGKALEYLEQSLAIRREIGDRQGEGATLNNISQIYKARGDYGKALEYLEQSLAILREIGDRQGEGTTLNNISQIYDSRGDYGKALEYLEQSLAIRREIGDRQGEGTTLNNIAALHHARGDYGKALEYMEQSLAIRREIGDRQGEGTTLNNISQIYDSRGDYGKALEYLEQSLAIRREIGDRQGEGATLNNISQIYDSRGDYGKALEYLEQSLAIRREIGDRSGMCATLFNLGHIHLQNEEADKAMARWVEVYRIAEQLGEAQVLAALDGLAKQMGREEGLAFWAALSAKFDSK